jgi:arginyl-tRNA synthetase
MRRWCLVTTEKYSVNATPLHVIAMLAPMPDTLLSQLSRIVADAFRKEGADASFGRVIVSNRPDLSDVQCDGAFAAAEQSGKSARELAAAIALRLRSAAAFQSVSVAGGYLNFTLADELLLSQSSRTLHDLRAPQASRIVIDYGGANVAKPLHIGHLRSAIIGESLKRISRALGHEVIGDVHLGDWGLQMGMVLHEIALRQPALPFFASGATPPFPEHAPVTLDDLDEIYPVAAANAERDPDYLAAARQTTLELQRGHPGYRALWQSIVDISVRDLRDDYSRLNVSFDLWYGESTVNDRLEPMVHRLVAEGHAHESEGALIIDCRGTRRHIHAAAVHSAEIGWSSTVLYN